jgi:ribA/ribD-fused uncharacterized protein
MNDKVIWQFSGEHYFLSNFSTSLIDYEGIFYVTVEHAFQAAKTLDPQERKRIAYLRTPGAAKRAGRELDLRRDWEDVKIPIMEGLLRDKFSDEALRHDLLDTHPAVLIEGNTWGDVFWGATEYELGIGNLQRWPLPNGTLLYGQNQLGKLLKRVRDDLRKT